MLQEWEQKWHKNLVTKLESHIYESWGKLLIYDLHELFILNIMYSYNNVFEVLYRDENSNKLDNMDQIEFILLTSNY